MPEPGLGHAEVADVDPETHLRELNRVALEIARERSNVDARLGDAREKLEAYRTELPVAERTAKTRRQSQLDAVRGRADLERRLQTLVEAETLARTRRQQAEQRAEGFRAAATFAASGREEGGLGDNERLDREKLVEARAIREASVAEARASEERAEEQKIGKLRAELEMHVAAEREVESAFALEREQAEARTAELHAEIARLSDTIAEAEIALEQLVEAAATIAAERATITADFDDDRRSTKASMEARIVELRRIEADARKERSDLETALAEFDASDAATTAARAATDVVPTPADAPVETKVVASAPVPDVPKAPLYVARPARPKEPEKAKKTESFIRPERTPYRPALAPAKVGDDEELIPGLKSLVGNIFTRAKKVEPIPEPVEPEESSSIADRIARDFGLLGGGGSGPA